MKTGILIYILCFGLNMGANLDLVPIVVSDERIEVAFNSNLEFDDLVDMKLELEDKGISLKYKMIEFNEFFKLKAIQFEVDCNDGYKGSAGSSRLNNKSRFGFYRDYSDDAEIPFATGELE